MLYTSHTLPLSKILLDDWQLIKVSGQDNCKFLQGQLTTDINKLSDNHWSFAAQCDPKGKVISSMQLFKRGDDIYYIVRKSLVETQLKELKKYAVFSKVVFEIESSLSIIGIADDVTSQQIPHFTTEHNSLTEGNLTFLKFDLPSTRYIVVGPQVEIDKRFADLNQATTAQWQQLDMQASYPIIDLPLCNQYLPQAFNLQNINGISFDKGCYCGQEMVARAQYRGINKRALYLLTGNADNLPVVGESLEQQMGDNWRTTGTVLSVLRIDNTTIWVQAILNNDIAVDTVFRVPNEPTSQLKLHND